MKGEALRDNEFVDISTLFQHAADAVPILANNVGGIQRPRIVAPRGTSFDIGQLTEEDRTRIPLTAPQPFVLPPVVLNSVSLFDDLGLQERLRRKLRDASYEVRGGESAQFVYVDAESMPDAIKPSGNYTITGEKIEVRIVLVLNGNPFSDINVIGNSGDIDGLAAETVRGLLQAITAGNSSQ